MVHAERRMPAGRQRRRQGNRRAGVSGARPLGEPSVTKLPASRIAMTVRLASAGGLPVTVTHLANGKNNGPARAKEVEALIKWTEKLGPTQLLLGDFNLKPEEAELQPMLTPFRTRGSAAGRAASRPAPARRMAAANRLHLLQREWTVGDGRADGGNRVVAGRRRVGSSSPRRDVSIIACVKVTGKLATCPKCMGALTEHHRCPRGPSSGHRRAVDRRGRRVDRHRRVIHVFNERPVPALVLAAAALGSVLASALRQAVNGR